MLITVIPSISSAFAQRLQLDTIPVKNWPLHKSSEQAVGDQYVAVSGGTSNLVFVAITPCRVLDTRSEGGSGKTAPFGPPSLAAGQARIVPVALSNCGVPAASDYSLNFVSITPFGQTVAWIAAWPDDTAWPGTVILNALQGGIVANSGLVASGADGGIQVLSTNNGDLVIDLNGYYVQAATVQGPIGPQGPPGNTGSTGPPGNAGSTGPSGAAGSPGATGIAGPSGASGAAGPAGSQGIQGVQGIQGAAGTNGTNGTPGASGAIGPQGPPVTFQGTWSIATTYSAGDAVFFNGSSYIGLSSGNIANIPSSGVPWALLAQQGSTGSTGAPGSNGTNGTNGTNGAQGLQGIPGAAGSPGPPQMFVAQFSNITAATSFAGLNGPITNQTIGAVATIMPSACTFNALYVAGTITGSVAPDVLTFTVMKNGVATTMTVSMSLSVAGTTVISTDTSHPFSVVAGDSVAIQVFQTNTTTTPLVRMSATTQCQ